MGEGGDGLVGLSCLGRFFKAPYEMDNLSILPLENGTVTPNACLSWPDFLALPLKNGLRGPCPSKQKGTFVILLTMKHLTTN